MEIELVIFSLSTWTYNIRSENYTVSLISLELTIDIKEMATTIVSTSKCRFTYLSFFFAKLQVFWILIVSSYLLVPYPGEFIYIGRLRK